MRWSPEGVKVSSTGGLRWQTGVASWHQANLYSFMSTHRFATLSRPAGTQTHIQETFCCTLTWLGALHKLLGWEGVGKAEGLYAFSFCWREGIEFLNIFSSTCVDSVLLKIEASLFCQTWLKNHFLPCRQAVIKFLHQNDSFCVCNE